MMELRSLQTWRNPLARTSPSSPKAGEALPPPPTRHSEPSSPGRPKAAHTMLDPEAFNALVDRIVALGYDEDTASCFAVQIGDTPDTDD